MKTVIYGFVIATLIACSAAAETLSDQLRSEGASSLAAAARTSGNAVRGAILFPSERLGCAQCHVSGGRNALGPDLTKLPPDRTDAQLVASLLDPSKEITKGYEQMLVATASGRVFSGRLVNRTETHLILRLGENPQQLLRIPNDGIEQSRRLETSAMPTGIVNAFEDRQQFLDVVRYLMTLRDAARNPARGGANVSQTDASRSLPDELEGFALVDYFVCDACHKNDIAPLPFPPRRGPDLRSAALRLRTEFIRKFIASPAAEKHGTSMPNLLGQIEPARRQEVAQALTDFIVSLSADQVVPAVELRVDDRLEDAVARGRALYHEVGCVGCHSPRDAVGHEPLADSSVPLGNLAAKYFLSGLVEFLEDPQSARPHGRMPNPKLTHWEALDIAQFLLAGSSPVSDRRPPQDARSVELGRKVFVQLGCGQCHPDVDLNWERNLPSFSELNVATGCLSKREGPWPNFALREEQRRAIAAALERPPTNLTSAEQIDVALRTFRCTQCHERDGRGGPGLDRAEYFQTTDLNLGPQGHVPPLLTNIGAKLQRAWLREVIVLGERVRPYMKTRMPAYRGEDVGQLIELLATHDRLPPADYGQVTDEKAMRDAGHRLAGTDGLNCVACHTFQELSTGTMQAIDLTVMARRLKKDWFYHYMISPQSMSPGTVMPSFWPGGRAIRADILDGKREQQLEALWVWLSDGRQARRPRGVTHERIELLASDEAVMLRRSYPNVGKRGIGVGYPLGFNIVFDSEQLRLATVWHGRFADPSGVWYSQGHGMVRPLERNPLQFTEGPDLDDAQQPWKPHGIDRPPHHRFLGYDLDDGRRPAFRYRFRNVEVVDYGVDMPTDGGRGATWRRRVTLASPSSHDRLRFRVASGRLIEQQPDGAFLVDGRLLVRTSRETPQPRIAVGEKANDLVIPLRLEPGTTTLVIHYSWKSQ